MNIHHLTVEEALASLQTSREGLTAAEAGRRLLEYGENQIPEGKRSSLLWQFAKGFVHFFALLLWVAAGLAFFAELNSPGQGMGTLGVAIVGVILINNVFSFWQEYRAEKALAALQRLLPHQICVRREGKLLQFPTSQLVPGDIIRVEAGEQVPADCRILETFGVRVSNASVTGESLAHARDAAVTTEQEFLHATNVLLAGSLVVTGSATALVCATGQHTAFGEIAHLSQATREPLSPLQKEIAQLSRYVSLLALLIGLVFFFVGRWVGLPFWANFIFAIGIIAANVPEGLLPTVTLALAIGSQRMARRNALIRHLPAVETLGAATVICTDKTGTVTQNKMTPKQLFLSGRWEVPGDAESVRRLASHNEHFFRALAWCEDLKRDAELRDKWLGDPLEIALGELGRLAFPGLAEPVRLAEVPFDSKRKRMSVVCQSAQGPILYLKGAPEIVLARSRSMVHGGKTVPLPREWKEQQAAAAEKMASEGLRVLAVAYRCLQGATANVAAAGTPPGTGSPALEELEDELTFAGLIGLEDPPRPEVPQAIQQCHEAGIKVIMITGDLPQTATAIARQVGLVRGESPVVVTGEHLRRLSNTQLQIALGAPEILFARVTAEQKLRIVSALKRKNEVVAVTGDGVNDAPALRKADIGIAMGLAGTEVARESADMVLLDDNFATIVAAIEEGRGVYANIRKFLTYILTSNIPELVPYLLFVGLKIPLALPMIQILAVDLGTDMLPALALGAEPPNPQTMKRPPRGRQEHLLNLALACRAYLWLGIMQAVAAMAVFLFVLRSGGWRYGQELAAGDLLYKRATTACLCGIVVMQMVNVFLCRSRQSSAFSVSFKANPLLRWALPVELGFLLWIAYTPWGNAVFGTAPPPAGIWVLLLPFALVFLGMEELRKWILRMREQTRAPSLP